jgi:hypothetical protein
MTDWTDGAHQVFDDYASKARARLRSQGADPDEVLGDLRQHIAQLAQERGLPVLTATDVSQMLASMSEPEPAPTGALPVSASHADEAARDKTWHLWFGGVVLPSIAFAVQATTGLCSVVLEPIPSFPHALLVLSVPVAAWLALRELELGPTRHFARVRQGVDFALGIACIYALLFLPLLPLSIVMLLVGIGLLGLSPLLAVFSLRSLHKRLGMIAPQWDPPRTLRSMGLALLALLLAELPTFVSGVGMHLADSPDPVSERAGLWILRRFGHEPSMRANAQRRNFEEGARRASLLLFPARMFDPVSTERAREIYYRATGEAADRKPLMTRNDRVLALDVGRDSWDEDQGTDNIGGIFSDLRLSASRIDVHVEPENNLGYMEWTQEFHNTGTRQREARAQWRLPEGAVVSRVTLWVEGEPREAAFAPTAQVKAAYREVVVRERRDPLLVTWSGPNSVLVQAFPIEPKKPFKIRIGITAPLRLDAQARGHIALPALVETNYEEADKLRHHVWVESSAALRADADEVSTLRAGRALRGSLSSESLRALDVDVGVTDVTAARHVNARLGDVCLHDSACGGETGSVSQRWVKRTERDAGALAFVIDGSRALAEQRDTIARLVGGVSPGTNTRVWLAADTPIALSDKVAQTKPDYAALARRIQDAEFVGGMDNTQALMAALDWLEGRENGQLIWIHGPQGVMLQASEGLAQRIERSNAPPRWTSLQLAPGANRVLQAAAPFAHVVSLEGVAGMERMRERLSGAATWTLAHEWHAGRVEGAPEAFGGNSHVVRLWASDLIAGRSLAQDVASKLAAQQQLVTHVSGAVVLERAEQYQRHGLVPVDPTSVPTIPEPPVFALLLVAALLAVLWRWRQWRPA